MGYEDRGNRGGSRSGGFGGSDRGGRSGGFRSGGGRGGGFRGSRPGPREMHSAICAACGKQCTVPFKPKGDRDVFCKECFAKQRESE